MPVPVTLERRAMEIADHSTSIAYVGNPAARREAVRKAALQHLREVAGVAPAPGTGDKFYEDDIPE